MKLVALTLRCQPIVNRLRLNLVRHSRVLLAGIQAAQIFWIPARNMRE